MQHSNIDFGVIANWIGVPALIFGILLAIDSFIFDFGILDWMLNNPYGQFTGFIALMSISLHLFLSRLDECFDEGFSFDNVFLLILPGIFLLLVITLTIYSIWSGVPLF